MHVLHRAFGLSLLSSRPIPGLAAELVRQPPDVHLWFDDDRGRPEVDKRDARLRYRSGDDDGPAALHVWTLDDGRYFRMSYADGTQFLVDAQGTRIWASWASESTVEDAATYLLGPVFGLVLRLRGRTCLHASAVALDGRAVALVGPAGAGKSTVAAAFAVAGERVLTDDIAVIIDREGVPYVQPAYAQLRLWPESVSLIFGAPDALPRLTPTWDKRAMDLGDRSAFADQPLPLSAIYLLDERSAETPIHVEPVAPGEGLLTLVANTYVGYLLDGQMRADDFACLASLARTVPIRRLIRPPDGGRVVDVCAAIRQDFETLSCTASPTTAR